MPHEFDKCKCGHPRISHDDIGVMDKSRPGVCFGYFCSCKGYELGEPFDEQRVRDHYDAPYFEQGAGHSVLSEPGVPETSPTQTEQPETTQPESPSFAPVIQPVEGEEFVIAKKSVAVDAMKHAARGLIMRTHSQPPMLLCYDCGHKFDTPEELLTMWAAHAHGCVGVALLRDLKECINSPMTKVTTP